jgi:glycosyltransferase involved in cell wall biosynthesis
MKLLHVHSGNLCGGVETLLRTLARCRQLCPAMEAEFALCFDQRIAAELREAGAAVHVLGRVRTRNPFQVREVRRRLLEVLRTGRFDAVICHMAWPLAVFAPTVRRAGLPLIFWMHDAVMRKNWLHAWASLNVPDLVLCNSRFTASTVCRLFNSTRSEILHYPVLDGLRAGPAERDALRSNLNTPRDAVVLLQASRMEAWKGHLLLFEALRGLIDDPRWICWIAGGPQRPQEIAYENNLHSAATRLGIGSRIRFLGQRSDVSRLLASADIYCQPNQGAEPFGIVFIEAMYAGLPVVATAAGGPLEIFDDSCGILTRLNDSVSLAATLEKLINCEKDRRCLGANGARRAAQLCDPLQQLQRLQAIIQQTVIAENHIPGSV